MWVASVACCSPIYTLEHSTIGIAPGMRTILMGINVYKCERGISCTVDKLSFPKPLQTGYIVGIPASLNSQRMHIMCLVCKGYI